MFVCHFHALCYHPHITTSSTVRRVAYIARLLISHTLQAYINDCVADSSCNWSCLLAKKVMSRSGSYAFIHNSLIFFLHPICYAWNHSRQGTVLIVTKEDGLFCASPLMVDCWFVYLSFKSHHDLSGQPVIRNTTYFESMMHTLWPLCRLVHYFGCRILVQIAFGKANCRNEVSVVARKVELLRTLTTCTCIRTLKAFFV